MYRAFIAFVTLEHGAEAETFFGDDTQLSAVVQNSVLSLSIFIGDSLIVRNSVVPLYILQFESLEDPSFVGCMVPKETSACGSCCQPRRIHW